MMKVSQRKQPDYRASFPSYVMVNYLKPKIYYNTDELEIRALVVCGHFGLYVLKLLSEGKPVHDRHIWILWELKK